MSAEDYIFEEPCESRERGMEEPDEHFQAETIQWFANLCEELPKNDNLEYIRIHHTTAKAVFYVIEDDGPHIYGFWIPKSVILKDKNNILEIKDWFEPTVIQFI